MPSITRRIDVINRAQFYATSAPVWTFWVPLVGPPTSAVRIVTLNFRQLAPAQQNREMPTKTTLKFNAIIPIRTGRSTYQWHPARRYYSALRHRVIS